MLHRGLLAHCLCIHTRYSGHHQGLQIVSVIERCLLAMWGLFPDWLILLQNLLQCVMSATVLCRFKSFYTVPTVRNLAWVVSKGNKYLFPCWSWVGSVEIHKSQTQGPSVWSNDSVSFKVNEIGQFNSSSKKYTP